jgi:hypothetical protein
MEEEEVLPRHCIGACKEEKIIGFGCEWTIGGYLPQIRGLLPESHYVKFNNFYNNILLFLFFSIAVVFFFPFFMERFVRLVCLQLLVIFCYGFLIVSCSVVMVVVYS